MSQQPITDTHCHIINRNALDYPWLENAPPLDRDWSIKDYEVEAKASGISRALHMEVDVAEARIHDETDYIASLAEEPNSLICGLISSCRPENTTFEAEIEAAKSRNLVKGFRRVLHVVPDDTSKSDQFRDNIRKLAAADLPFDICVLARQLPIALDLVDAAPETRFVLDHCGVPDIANDGWDDWAQNINALANRGNLSVKISGLPAYAAPDWSSDDLGRWIIHVVEAFTPARCVWGGDWPVCTLGGGLTNWVKATREVLGQLSETERAAIYNDNATRIWNL